MDHQKFNQITKLHCKNIAPHTHPHEPRHIPQVIPRSYHPNLIQYNQPSLQNILISDQPLHKGIRAEKMMLVSEEKTLVVLAQRRHCLWQGKCGRAKDISGRAKKGPFSALLFFTECRDCKKGDPVFSLSKFASLFFFYTNTKYMAIG